MTAGATFEVIATNTLGSATPSINFTSIPGTYTDLRLVVFAKGDGSSYVSIDLRFNSATSGYSYTSITGSGSAATSSYNTSAGRIYLSNNLPPSGSQLLTADIFSYAGSTYKTSLMEMNADDNGSGSVFRQVALFSSTSVISSINLIGGGGNIGSGTTATLYGILKA